MASTINFDPYHKWLGIPPDEQPPHHYRLLAIGLFESDADVIQSAADQRMAHVRTFQSGPHAAVSQKLLNELAGAKVCLLKPERKIAYDTALKKKLEATAPAVPATVVKAALAPTPAQASGAPLPKVVAPVMARPVAPLAASPALQAAGGIPDFAKNVSTISVSHIRRKKMTSISPLMVGSAFLALVLVIGGAIAFTNSQPKSVAQKPQQPIATKIVSPAPPKSKENNPPSKEDPPVVAPKADNLSPPSQPIDSPQPAAPPAQHQPATVKQRRMPACIDDGEPGFTAVGLQWIQGTEKGVGYKDTHHFHPTGQGEASARWVFDGLEKSRTYDVYATWNGHDDYSTNASYRLIAAGGLAEIVTVNQQIAPKADAKFNDFTFQKLGRITSIVGVIEVRLANNSDNPICADAILLIPARTPPIAVNKNTPPNPESQIPDQTAASIPAPQPAQPMVDPNNPQQPAQNQDHVFKRFSQAIEALAMPPDGRQVFCITANTACFELATGLQLGSMYQGGQAFAYLPELELLAVARAGQVIHLYTQWIPSNGTDVGMQFLNGGRAEHSAIAGSANERYLVSGGLRGVDLWQLKPAGIQSGSPTESWNTLPNAVNSLAVSDDGQHLWAGCGGSWQGTQPTLSGDNHLYYYNVGKRVQQVVENVGGVWAMNLSADNKLLYTASQDSKIRVWNAGTGKKNREWRAHQGGVTCLALASEARLLVSGGDDGVVRLWNAINGRMLREFKDHQGTVRSVAITPDGLRLVSGGNDGVLCQHQFEEAPATREAGPISFLKLNRGRG